MITKMSKQVYLLIYLLLNIIKDKRGYIMNDFDVELRAIRQQNLIMWFEENPIPKEESSLISRLKNGKMAFGERLARRLERDYGMPKMYLDCENNVKIDRNKSANMNIIRKHNLITWFDIHPIPQEEKSLISQLKNGKISFGRKLARRLEKDYQMPAMYLDNENSHFNVLKNENALSKKTENSYLVQSIHFKKEFSAMLKDFEEHVIAIEFNHNYAKKVFGTVPSEKINFASFLPDTMEDTIKKGSTIFLDINTKRFIGDGIYMFVYKNYPHLNRLQMQGDCLIVISDNPRYKDWEIKREDFDSMLFVGKVVGYYPEFVRL